MQLSLGTVLRGKDLEEFLLNGIGEKKMLCIQPSVQSCRALSDLWLAVPLDLLVILLV